MAGNEQNHGEPGDVLAAELAAMTPEEQMFHYSSKGDGNNLATLLAEAGESGLDIDAKDSEGSSAMGIAIKNGFVLPLMHLLDNGAKLTDTLLRAVDADFEEAVIVIVEFAKKQPRAERDAILKCKCETTDIHPDVTPIIRAAQKNNFALVKILYETGLRVEEVDKEDLEANTTDSLQRSVGTLEIYKALASPAYVCFDRDPIARAFHLSMLLRRLAHLEVEFSLPYSDLANGMEQYAADILSCAMTTEEVMAILAYHGKGGAVKSEKEVKALGLLPTINRAIAHDQKKFVAQPTCQHALRIQFARQLITLQEKPFVFSIFLRILIIMLFPILCIVYKLGVSEKCNQFVKIPMVKFFMQLASDLFLLGMIMYEIIGDDGRRANQDLTAWHYMIYIYGLAMLWREILYIWKKRHQRNVISTMNIVNMMIGLLLVALVNNQIVWNAYRRYTPAPPATSTPVVPVDPTTSNQNPVQPTFDSVNLDYSALNDSAAIKMYVKELFDTIYRELYRGELAVGNTLKTGVSDVIDNVKGKLEEDQEPDFSGSDWVFMALLSRSIMSLIVVISFSRIQPFFIAIDSVGPFSISLKSMFITTMQFLSVVITVLFGFATSLTFIYGDSYLPTRSGEQGTCQNSGGRGGSCGDQNYFESQVKSMATLYWSLFGLIPAESVESDTVDPVLVSIGTLLYAFFYVFSVLVLLNALIAVMSNVYNVVEENADTEWKFHRTRLWMSFLDETFTVPPPFNLLPNLMPTLRSCGANLKKCICCLYCRERKKNTSNNVAAGREDISMESISTGDTASRLNALDATRVDNKTYKRVVVKLVERYINERTSHERAFEGDITLADMRNLKNDVIGLRYNLFKEVWCINEKLSSGHSESEGIDTEMTTVQGIFNALARNKQDLETFETDVREWLKNMVKRLRYLPDVEMLEVSIPSAARSVRKRRGNSVEEMVGYYESLKRQKSQRRKRKLLEALMAPPLE